MNYLTEPLTFTIELTADAYRLAEQLSRKQKSHSQKAKQVYLNTLAVYAVDFYLQFLGIDTDISGSDSWNPVIHSLSNVADLKINDQGKLECIPVLPNAKVCHVPPEVWSDRVGYVVVEIAEEAETATLLGFVRKVTTEELPLSQLKSLDDLIDVLSSVLIHQPQEELPKELPILERLHQEISANKVISKAKQGLVHLGKWFEGYFEEGWQPEELVVAVNTMLNIKEADVNGAKIIRLGMEMPQQPVVLILRQEKISLQETRINLRLYPSATSMYLPDEVKLTVLDEAGNPIPRLEAQARAANWLQLQFTGEPGDKFSIRVSLGDDSFTENFLI